MKITCTIPTRRGNMVIGAVHSFTMLESRRHEVSYVVGVDRDDHPTISTAHAMATEYRVGVALFPRQPALGSYHNIMAANYPADAYCVLSDDLVCASRNWDDEIAQVVEREENTCDVWCHDTDEQRRAIYPIYTERWRRAAGNIFTDLFPFWYDDVWLQEIVAMVYDVGELPRLAGAKIHDCPMPTTRMRDLIFWDDFFHGTRLARLEMAQQIAAKLDVRTPVETMVRRLSTFARNESFRSRADEVQRIQGDDLDTAPTPEYVAAKQRAEKILATIAENTTSQDAA